MAEVGAIVEATVEKVMDYGAFVRLETGETGMVHISEIDKNYVKDIRDHVRENDKVTVKVIKQAEPGYEAAAPRRSGKDPDFERKLKKFMSQSQERLVDLKRHKEGKR
jgi:S1 RNA binding domain protein